MASGVDLREIRTFLTLAEELHYGRTAERLGITASRVSQTIRTLEVMVGGRLFERTSRRVRLTPLGEHLRREMAPSYEQIQRALKEAREVATGVAGSLRLGTYSPINGGPHLFEIIKTFQSRHPRCRVQLIDTGLNRNPLDSLRQDEVDLLAMRLPLDDADLVIGPLLSREPRVLLVSKDHPIASQSSIRYEDLAGLTVPYTPALPREVMDALVPPRTPSGRRMSRALTRTTSEALMRVAAGELVHPTVQSFLDYFPSPGVIAIPITDLPPSETALVWLRTGGGVKVDAFARAATDVLGRPKR